MDILNLNDEKGFCPVMLEYLWGDGNTITTEGRWHNILEPGIRRKTKTIRVSDTELALLPHIGRNSNISKLPFITDWSFDGSSTKQAEGKFSDCILKPVNIYYDHQRTVEKGIRSYIVVCEVFGADNKPHPTNTRAMIDEDNDSEYWISFEQEYFINLDGETIMKKMHKELPEQFQYYCAVGAENIHPLCEEIADQHTVACLAAGLNHEGINPEVAPGQYEYQLMCKGAKKAGDDLMVSRFLLKRIAGQYGLVVNLHPKPMGSKWNGSGMHVNFSNKAMREKGSKEMLDKICKAFGNKDRIEAHIRVYGSENDQRLTGLHETQSIDNFSYGISDRGASIRIPIANVVKNYCPAYLEDRRTASNADGYQVVREVITSVKLAGV